MSGSEIRTFRADDGQPTEQDDQQQGGKAPKYVAGPGFEIAVRAGSVREMELRVPERNEGPQGPRRPNDESHSHAALELRLSGVEQALHAVVDQLKRVEEKVDALSRRPAQ